MKHLWIIVAIILVGCQETNEEVTPESNDQTTSNIEEVDSLQNTENLVLDSITLYNVYARNPYKLETISYDSLLQLLPTYFIMETEVIDSRQADIIPDTLYKARWDKTSLIQFISSPYIQHLYDYAEILDESFLLKGDIHIGISLSDFKSKFEELKGDPRNYSFIEFFSGEASYHIYFDFVDGRLVRIRHFPYTG